MLTCRSWARIGTEFMYRSILVSNVNRLRELCTIFDENSNLGWWTKGLYIYSDSREGIRDLSVSRMDDCVISLVRHFPNLQIFIVDPPIGPSFSNVADAVRTYARSLKSLQWKIPYEIQSKIVPAIVCMQDLVALEIHLSHPVTESEGTLPGIRALVDISFPHLRELNVCGAVQDLVEHIGSWHMPQLCSLKIDFKYSRDDFPDIVEALATYGPQLRTLDINSIANAPMDVPSVLSICPNLTTFCFNLDWQLEGNLIARVHQNIENIGLHGLRHAFGVGYASELAEINPFEAIIMRRRNDINFDSLVKKSFPRLCLIRVLDPGLLHDLNKNNGPAEGVCYGRWEKWWEHCTSQRIRLEDCTGSFLGTLPEKDESESESEDDLHF